MFTQHPGPEGPAPGTTGRYLILFREEDGGQAGASALSNTAGLSAVRAADFEEGAVEAERMQTSEAIVFDELAVAVVDAAPEQARALGAAVAEDDNPILAAEP